MTVAIIGAGIMGCATARALAKRGAQVILLERAIPGAEASSAAAGMLGAQVEMHEKFGLEFRIVDTEYLKHLRREQGIHAKTGVVMLLTMIKG